MESMSEHEFLAGLRARGATALTAVRFRDNRSTIWSLTQRGTVLNLHVGYRRATPQLLEDFAAIAADPRGAGARARTARRKVRRFPPLREALRDIRARVPARRARPAGVGPDCASQGQRRYLRALYDALNRRHFGGRLPRDVPLRLSRRMRRTYGWVTLRGEGRGRAVGELALNLDLMLEENDAKRLDVMLHEMAHIEVWLRHGERGHGRAWKAAARRVGCEPRACSGWRITRRRSAGAPIERVPELPPGWSVTEHHAGDGDRDRNRGRDEGRGRNRGGAHGQNLELELQLDPDPNVELEREPAAARGGA